MCCGWGAGDRAPPYTYVMTSFVVLYLNVYVRDLTVTWASTSFNH